MTGFKTVASMVSAMIDDLKITVPVALHLDTELMKPALTVSMPVSLLLCLMVHTILSMRM